MDNRTERKVSTGVMSREIRIEVLSTETIKDQINAQYLHMAGYATASLERSRQAILQLGAANLLTPHQRAAVERRFRLAVQQALRRYIGGRYKVTA